MRLSIERSDIAKTSPQRLDGVLVLEEDIGGKAVRHAFAVSAAPMARAGHHADSGRACSRSSRA